MEKQNDKPSPSLGDIHWAGIDAGPMPKPKEKPSPKAKPP